MPSMTDVSGMVPGRGVGGRPCFLPRGVQETGRDLFPAEPKGSGLTPARRPCSRGRMPRPRMAARDCRPTSAVGRHSHADGGWPRPRTAARDCRHPSAVGRHSHADGAKPPSSRNRAASPMPATPETALRLSGIQGWPRPRMAARDCRLTGGANADGAKPSSRKPRSGYPGSTRGQDVSQPPRISPDR
jgi:hypothetical protein